MHRNVLDTCGGVAGREVPHVVVVDPHFDRYAALAASARQGKLEIHFRATGSDALKIAGRRRVDAWLVGTDLDDMSGADFVDLLRGKLAATSPEAFPAQATVAMTSDGANGIGICEAGVDRVLSPPISFRDLESLLGVASLEQAKSVVGPLGKSPAFVAFPVGVGAAVVAIALLMMG